MTSQYLLPYANTKDELLKMCEAAFSALKSGGTCVGVTTFFDAENPPKAQSTILGKDVSIYFNNVAFDQNIEPINIYIFF